MLSNDDLKICLILILLIINQISGLAVSYNQPKFCPNASWNPNGITFADTTIVGQRPTAIFVNINNTVYITASSLNQIQVFNEGSFDPTRTISGSMSPESLFVTFNNDLYVGSGSNNQVDMWTSNATTSILAMNVNEACLSLFVDIANCLYCSLGNSHRVIKKGLNSNSNTSVYVAGTGASGSSSYMLHRPSGIFVNINFNLYVADSGNHRIQLYKPGQVNGITIAGNGAMLSITLNHPTGIALDADGYFFIVDQGNHRIIGSGPHGFRCLVGCSGKSGSSSFELMHPTALSFDSHGNFFLADMGNNRIQLFVLISNNCSGLQTTTTTSSTSNSITTTSKALPTKTYTWTDVGSSANDYSFNYYFIPFLFCFSIV